MNNDAFEKQSVQYQIPANAINNNGNRCATSRIDKLGRKIAFLLPVSGTRGAILP